MSNVLNSGWSVTASYDALPGMCMSGYGDRSGMYGESLRVDEV